MTKQEEEADRKCQNALERAQSFAAAVEISGFRMKFVMKYNILGLDLDLSLMYLTRHIPW